VVEGASEAKGDDAVRMVADQPWDPSVQSLVAFPQALATLGQDPGWVQRVGDAFLAQPDDLMDAVQRLRRQAQDAGNLTSNEFQKVSTEQPPPEVIAAAQAVPTSDVAGGAIEAPPAARTGDRHPTGATRDRLRPQLRPQHGLRHLGLSVLSAAVLPAACRVLPMGGALMRGVAFGTGVAIADSLWGDTDWWGNDVDINVSHYNNINTNRTLNSTNNTWRHDPARRDGVPYRDNANRERYGRQMEGAGNRAQFRGEDANRTRQREQARQSMQQRGVEGPARSNAEARASARNVERSPEARAARERAGGDQRANAARTASDRAAADRARAGGDQRANAHARQAIALQPIGRVRVADRGMQRVPVGRGNGAGRRRVSRRNASTRRKAIPPRAIRHASNNRRGAAVAAATAAPSTAPASRALRKRRRNVVARAMHRRSVLRRSAAGEGTRCSGSRPSDNKPHAVVGNVVAGSRRVGAGGGVEGLGVMEMTP
jgi:hypothetical protein